MQNAAFRTEKTTGINFSGKNLFKLLVSASLLAALMDKIPFSSLQTSLAKCQWPCLIIAFMTVNLCMVVSTLKWQPLLTVLKVQIPFLKLLSFYYAGLFANNFLPSSIGGDALRIYDAAKASGKTKEAAASVIMERLLASLALALTAAAALALGANPVNDGFIYRVVGGIAVICLALFAALFFIPFNTNSKIGPYLNSLSEYRKHPPTLGRVLLLSFAFQGLLVLVNIFTFQAMGTHLPPATHFLYIPVIMAVSMVPLSINGLGIREGMYVLLYGFAGVEPATAITCSLLFFMLVTACSLAGGVIIAARK
ncbi:MAG: flippase-like domain-containing protein [Firmicutes bacterium]|nr:flippase-like domain-containing protein [Bacillota bacterium]